MTLPLENLDNKTFDDLVKEAVTQIPVYAPEWTDFNRSDPGITLIELFAWLTEMQIYRLNKITNGNYVSFLKLCGIQSSNEDLEEQIFEAKKALKGINRAVTSADYEYLAMKTDGVARVKALPLFHPKIKGDVPNTVSVIILPDLNDEQIQSIGRNSLILDKKLLSDVYNDLNTKRPLSIEIFVLYPEFVNISVVATVVKKQEYLDKNVQKAVEDALNMFLHPLKGGADGHGWPFGRPVYISEIYEVIDNVKGVDYVKPDPGLSLSSNGKASIQIIEIPDHALVNPSDHKIDVKEA